MKEQTLQVQKQGTMELAPVQQSPTVGQMLQAVIEKGVTTENVAAIEKLVGLYERMQDRDAEKAFNMAFVALQQDLPQIEAKTVIANRGKYERFEDVMLVVSPLLVRHGFSASFEQQADDKRITVVCILRHAQGHSTRTPFSVRMGGRSDSETQADCKASTTAKRNALLQALNIVVRQDALQDEHDPRNEGGAITKEQAGELEHRLKMVNGDIAAFLKLADAKTFSDIPAGKYDMLDSMLTKKENRGQ